MLALCNIFMTGSCVKLLYYPRCLENKVVVLSKPSQLVLLCHRAILLLVCFTLHPREGARQASIGLPTKFASTHLYFYVERGREREKCLDYEHHNDPD